MFKVLLSTGQWIYHLTQAEAIQYLEEGYHPIRM